MLSYLAVSVENQFENLIPCACSLPDLHISVIFGREYRKENQDHVSTGLQI